MQFKKVLVTGAWGFVASNLADHIYNKGVASKYIFLDAGFIGSNKLWMEPYADKENVTALKLDLSKEETYNRLVMMGHTDIDCIYHLASQSHVDRSINDGIPFFTSSVTGTARLLEFSRELDLKLFINFSTDEVLGQRTELQGPFHPYERKMVRNPYSSAKSSQEEIGFAYAITHDIPVVTTRCTNIYGPRQYPEKFLPVIITKLMEGKKIPLYGQGLQEREWLHVNDVCSALDVLVDAVLNTNFDLNPTDAHYNIFHIAGEVTYPNIDFMKIVIASYCKLVGKDIPQSDSDFEKYFDFVEDRKGHDFRYDLDASSIKRLGWKPNISLQEGIIDTINWYLQFFKDNPKGWE